MADKKTKARTLRRETHAPAYTLLDISELDEELRKDIIEDARAGGGLYGVRVVEESIFGGASAPIYGVYKDGPDADRWAKAKKELGISGSEIADGDVVAGAGAVEITDPRREAALREQAAQRVEAEAARIRAGEDAEVARITGEEVDNTAGVDAQSRMEPRANTTDPTLDPNAENEAANAENQEDTQTSRSTRRQSNKAPK